MSLSEADRRRSELRALTWAALLAVAAIAYVAEPLGLGLLLGTLLAFVVQPLNGRLERWVGPRAGALLTTALATVLVTGAIAGLVWMLAAKGAVHLSELIAALGPGAPGGGALATLGRWASRLGFSPEEVPERARAWTEAAAARLAGNASALLSVTTSTLLTLFFMMLALHFVLRQPQLVVRAALAVLPLRPEWTSELFNEFRRVGKTTLFGALVTGVAQGLLATLGYWIAGVPDPIFYGGVTAVVSLVPAVGTTLVWAPVGLVWIFTGHPVGGTFELIWGALVVVGVSDYVIRPRLVGGENELPALLTFVSLFGGVEAFGLKGLIVGPVLMSLGVAVLRLYAREARGAAPAGPATS